MENLEQTIKLSVVIPVYNEQDNITELYKRLKKTLSTITVDYELIFVNDGSKDNTLLFIMNLAKNNNRIKYVSFSRNFGHQVAITAGLDYCSGDAIVIMDGDLQDPPELISKLYDKYKLGYNVVYTKRKSRRGETIFKKVTAKMFYRFLKRLTVVDIPLDTGDFRLIDKKIVEYLKLMPEQNKFLRGQIAWLGFRQSFVEFKREKRKAGKTSYSLKKMINFAIDGIVAFSDVPLRFVSFIGFSVSLIAFVIILYALFSYFVWNRVATGWSSVIISSMFIGGIQLMSIGILGEYISRINNNMQRRPLYIIKNSNMKKKYCQ